MANGYERHRIVKTYNPSQKGEFNDDRGTVDHILEDEATQISEHPKTGVKHYCTQDGDDKGHVEYTQTNDREVGSISIDVSGEKGRPRPSIVDKLSDGLKTEPILNPDKDSNGA